MTLIARGFPKIPLLGQEVCNRPNDLFDICMAEIRPFSYALKVAHEAYL